MSAFKFLQKGGDFFLTRIGYCRERVENLKLFCSQTLSAFKIKAANVLANCVGLNINYSFTNFLSASSFRHFAFCFCIM